MHLLVSQETANSSRWADDNGATRPWADKSTGLPSAPVTDVVVAHTDRDRVAVTIGGTGTGHVFLSTNGAVALP